MFEAILQVAVAPAVKSVPVPFAAVFHPTKLNPDLTRLPVLLDAVNDDPKVALEDEGVDPLVFPLPLYVTV